MRKTLENEEASFNQTLDRGLDRFYLSAMELLDLSFSEQTRNGNMTYEIQYRGWRSSGSSENPHNKIPRHFKIDLPSDLNPVFGPMSINPPAFSGERAFELYDTFGFPIDLTELLCKELGLSANISEFEKLMEQQRERARAAQKSTIVRALDISSDAVTEFIGFEEDETEATVLEIHPQEDTLFIITDKTAFYAEIHRLKMF